MNRSVYLNVFGLLLQPGHVCVQLGGEVLQNRTDHFRWVICNSCCWWWWRVLHRVHIYCVCNRPHSSRRTVRGHFRVEDNIERLHPAIAVQYTHFVASSSSGLKWRLNCRADFNEFLLGDCQRFAFASTGWWRQRGAGCEHQRSYYGSWGWRLNKTAVATDN